ncbi:MAG: hypothetical protein PHQ85_06315 [Eubacteriales bacterium]|jgi:hypothetical protein|nr:hypothetical protein [Eubacteriales bacterium]MDD4106252.1 hypothetical protein [Eubacteriales bacterium]MDD4710879.1 hypothetical protein [Eubacteriales bacterium]
MLKKLSVILLVLAMMVTATACKKEEPAATAVPTEVVTVETTANP